jgi:amino acid transporter
MTTTTGTTARPPDGHVSDGASSFRLFDMVLFSVCAILLLSQLTVTASIGPTAIFWTLVIIIVFFVPYGLVTSELGSTYPDAGGIYAWVVRAFGSRWGTRVSWLYWVNVAIWVPSVYLMFSGAVSSMFFGGNLTFWVQVAIAVVLIWINFWVNVRGLGTGTWVSNVGAGITVLVIGIIGVSGVVYALQNGSATTWSLDSILPQDAPSAMALAIPVILYNFLGFELMSSASPQMANPKRDVPRTIAAAGLLIGGFYLVATVGMQLLIPADQISKTTGLIDVLNKGLGTSDVARAAVTILGIGSLFCFFAALIPWTIGANLSAAEAGNRGSLPKVFGRTHSKLGTPVGAAMLCSVVGTLVTVGFAALDSLTNGAVDNLFWQLFAFSSLIFLLPYVVMMLAFRKLRRSDSDRPRPYRVPGGIVVAEAVSWLSVVVLVIAAVFFTVNPWSFDPGVTFPILVGLAITLVIQEIFCHMSPRWSRLRAVERGEEVAPATNLSPNLS